MAYTRPPGWYIYPTGSPKTTLEICIWPEVEDSTGWNWTYEQCKQYLAGDMSVIPVPPHIFEKICEDYWSSKEELDECVAEFVADSEAGEFDGY